MSTGKLNAYWMLTTWWMLYFGHISAGTQNFIMLELRYALGQLRGTDVLSL